MIPGSPWVELSVLARDKGVSSKKMRRRIRALEHEYGVKLLSRKNPDGAVRGYFVHLPALKRALERDPDGREAEIGYLNSKFDELGKKVDAIARSHNALKRRVNQLVPGT